MLTASHTVTGPSHPPSDVHPTAHAHVHEKLIKTDGNIDQFTLSLTSDLHFPLSTIHAKFQPTILTVMINQHTRYIKLTKTEPKDNLELDLTVSQF
jgi:hypothetical protein